jgi:zinc finger BED domain-containing protein 1 (E3 SUMO-protein ligase ZBED1)
LSDTQKQYLQQFRDLIDKCRSIVGFFNHSDKQQHELAHYETDDGKPLRQLIQEVSTRWNSTYAMVKRLHEQADPVNRILTNANKYNLVLSETEVRLLKEAINVLRPLQQATELLSATRYPTAGLVLPVYHKLPGLMVDLVSDAPITKSVRYVIRQGIEIYTDRFNIHTNEYLIVATYLHPTYKLFNGMVNAMELSTSAEAIISNTAIALDIGASTENQLQDEMSVATEEYNLFSDASRGSTNAVHRSLEESLRTEFIKYIADSLQESPLKYWASNRSRFPILSAVAQVYLCIPATSVPSECLFSHAGYSIWERRNKLNPGRVDKMMFLYDNQPKLFLRDDDN